MQQDVSLAGGKLDVSQRNSITALADERVDADVIAVDPSFVAPIAGVTDDDPDDLVSRLVYRTHPDMVRAAWVRGRRLEGPGARG